MGEGESGRWLVGELRGGHRHGARGAQRSRARKAAGHEALGAATAGSLLLLLLPRTWLALNVWLTGNSYVEPSGRLPARCSWLPGAKLVRPLMLILSKGPT